MNQRCCLSLAAAVCAAMSFLPLPAFAQGTEHQHETPAIKKPASPVTAPRGERPVITATRVTDRVRMDGVLDEADWSKATTAANFVQQEPQEGQPATDNTEVRVLYDAGHLYIGVRAYSSLPVTATEMRRDADRLFDEDNFQV